MSSELAALEAAERPAGFQPGRQCFESYSWEQVAAPVDVNVAARGPPQEVVILEIPVAATVRGRNVRVSWNQRSLSVQVDGKLLVGGELSAPIRVDEDSDTTWQMSTTDSGQNIVQVTLHKAGYGLWERCFTDEIPQHVHEKAMAQLESKGRKLVEAGQKALADEDWASAEDWLAQATEIWTSMNARARGSQKGAYEPYAAAARQAWDEAKAKRQQQQQEQQEQQDQQDQQPAAELEAPTPESEPAESSQSIEAPLGRKEDAPSTTEPPVLAQSGEAPPSQSVAVASQRQASEAMSAPTNDGGSQPQSADPGRGTGGGTTSTSVVCGSTLSCGGLALGGTVAAAIALALKFIR